MGKIGQYFGGGAEPQNGKPKSGRAGENQDRKSVGGILVAEQNPKRKAGKRQSRGKTKQEKR